MDSRSFREFGKAAVDFVADYLENIRNYDVLPSVKPGYLIDVLPKELPEKQEDWRKILEDMNSFIIPGITHWQSPNMHAFYPTASSYPSIIGEMLAAGLSVMGFSWICSPACTELEVIVLDWLAKFLNLPQQFLHSSKGPGGGVIQGSASESILVAVIAAREHKIAEIKKMSSTIKEKDIRGKFVGYSSDQSNSCVEKSGLLAAVPIRLLQSRDDFKMDHEELKQTIDRDIANGLIPLICIATLGTTGTCAYDDINAIGDICGQYNIWLHVDAAYAGGALCLEEYSELRNGLEKSDSLNFNLHKFLKINFDCCAMWLKDSNKVTESFNVERIYLKHNYEGQSEIPDFRHWQIPLGRRFRALKVWITFRSEGAEGLRKHIKKHITLAERFEKHVLSDNMFELVTKQTLGLVCFRPKGGNYFTSQLLQKITERKKIFLVQAKQKNAYFLRFVVCGMDPCEEDIDFAWNEIKFQLSEIFKEEIPRNLIKESEKELQTYAKSATGNIISKIESDFVESYKPFKSK